MSSAPLTVLGIETSCDETAASVVRISDRVEVLSSVIATQFERHAPYGGVVPEIAARAHVEMINSVIAEAMSQAGLSFAALDGVAATAGPGLIGGVMVGLAAGKAIAISHDLPLIAVNHLEGHAVSVRLTEPAPYPYLLLLASGGHCQLLSVSGIGRCHRIGATIDDAAGEAFDKIAMTLGLGYPGGPALERLAEGGDPKRFAVPRFWPGARVAIFPFQASRPPRAASPRASQRTMSGGTSPAPCRRRSRANSRKSRRGRWRRMSNCIPTPLDCSPSPAGSRPTRRSVPPWRKRRKPQASTLSRLASPIARTMAR